jgi:hypothetical protein
MPTLTWARAVATKTRGTSKKQTAHGELMSPARHVPEVAHFVCPPGFRPTINGYISSIDLLLRENLSIATVVGNALFLNRRSERRLMIRNTLRMSRTGIACSVKEVKAEHQKKNSPKATGQEGPLHLSIHQLGSAASLCGFLTGLAGCIENAVAPLITF